MINQQLINQLLINLLFAGLQVSKLVVSTVLLYPLVHQFTFHQVHCLNLGWSRKSMKFHSISNTPKNHQNGVSRPPKMSKMRSQEVPEVIKITKVQKKMKSYENNNIYYTFEGLGHQNSSEFPFKNQQKT